MSQSRQFLVPTHYDVNQSIYPKNDIVRRRRYMIDELRTKEQFLQTAPPLYIGETNLTMNCYADKLRQREKH